MHDKIYMYHKIRRLLVASETLHKIIVHGCTQLTLPSLHCLDIDLHVHSSFMTYQAMNYGGEVDCCGTSGS